MASSAPKLGVVPVNRPVFQAEDILTPEQLAERLKVKKSWVFEQTRQRATTRNKNPLPCVRMGKYIRFLWPQVCEWMAKNGA